MCPLRRIAKTSEIDYSKISIVGLIEQTGTTLTQIGSLYSGFCPLHADKDTPSLRVYPNTNSWCCFGSGCGDKALGQINGGDGIEWVKQRFDYDYKQAIDWLRINYDTNAVVPASPPKHVEPPRAVKNDLVVYWYKLLDYCDRRGWFHDRGFADDFIDSQMFGWNGRRYVIPVWEGEPGNSKCLGVRLRRSEIDDVDSPKYIGMAGHNPPTVWGRWHCQKAKLVVAFAGELDAARAVQDNFPAFSMVNGANAWKRFPENWANDWFPDANSLVACFDRKEELQGAGLAGAWEKQKGSLSSRVFHWPPSVEAKDFCEFRDEGGTADKFWDLVLLQLEAPYK